MPMNLITGRYDDPQKAYEFEMEFISVYSAGQNLKYRVKQVSVPMNTVETQKRYVGSTRYNVPLRSNSANIMTVTFYDVQGMNTWRYFRSWFEVLSSEKYSFSANPEMYQRMAALRLEGHSLMTDTYIGFSDIYPIEVGDITLNTSDSSEVTFDVRFYYSGMGVI